MPDESITILDFGTFLAWGHYSSVYNTYYELFWALPARDPGLGAVTPPANNAMFLPLCLYGDVAVLPAYD